MLDRGLLTEVGHATLGDYVIDLSWSPDGSRLAAVTVEGAVFLFDVSGERAGARPVGQHVGGGNSLAWSADGGEFATAGHDGLAKVWDGISGEELCSLEAGHSWVGKVRYNPFRNELATAAGKQLKLWNSQRAVFYESASHASTIADIGWRPDGSGVAAAAYQGISLHVPGRRRDPRKYTWKGSSLALAWSPDGKYIATGEQDSTVHFWHMISGRDAQMSGFPTKVLELSWSSKGQWLATSGGTSVCLWDCSGKGPEGRAPRELMAHSTRVTQVAFQPDGKLLASSDVEGFVVLWNPANHDKAIGARALSSTISCLRWTKGARLAAGLHDGRVVILRV